MKQYNDIEWLADNEWGVHYQSHVGERFGRLVVLKEGRVRRTDGHASHRYYCLCKCDCGNEKIIDKSTILRTDGVRSCGCLAREIVSKLRKKPDGVAEFNEIYGQYRKSARNRGYEFSLSKEDFKRIITQPCTYCGRALTQIKKKKGGNIRVDGSGFRYTGIDRYDNAKGYTLGNSVPCCEKCNRIKRDMDVNEMADHLEKMLSRKDFWKRTA